MGHVALSGMGRENLPGREKSRVKALRSGCASPAEGTVRSPVWAEAENNFLKKMLRSSQNRRQETSL